MIKRLLLFSLSLFLVISCATVNALMQPDWTYTTPKVSGAVMYVGHGTGFSEDAAKDRAYQEILDKIGNDLGYEIGTQFFREIVATDSISSLSTTITDSYVYQQTDGEWNYYVLARTAQDVLLNSRSPNYISLLEREGQIEDKLSETISLYQENRDVEAINKVLEAIILSLEGDVNNPDYTPESLMKRAIGYAENLRITLSKAAKDSIGVTVKVRRTKGLFYPPVERATVVADYSMLNVEGDVISSSIRCRTNDNGSFRFLNTNPYTLREGSISFSILLDNNLLSQIESKAQEGFLDELNSVLDSKKVVYSYSDSGRLSPNDLLIAVALYDEDGNLLDNTDFIAEVEDYLDKAKMPKYTFINAFGDEFEDIFFDLAERYPGYEYFIVMRVGLTDFKNYQDEIYARTEGRVIFYHVPTESEIATQDSYMVGSGPDIGSASSDSIAREARIIAGRLLEEL